MIRKTLNLALFLLFFSTLSASEISDILQEIPSYEREKIERLFSFFVRRDSLGYVLFGDTKPACATGISITSKIPVSAPRRCNAPMYFEKDLKKCWEAWVRYRHLFKHPNILICEEYKKINGGIYLRLHFINKKTVKPLLEKYSSEFASVLGKNFSPETFLAKVEKKKKLRPLIHHDEKLFGLILGFGPESSTAFKAYQEGIEMDSPLGYVVEKVPECRIVPVSFRGNPHSAEVQALVCAYTRELKAINKIYESDDFLKLTLEKLCAH